MKDELFEKVSKLIAAANKELSPEEITMESTFEDLNLDSLDAISLISDLENEYKIVLSNEEVMKIKSVGEAVDSLERVIMQSNEK